MLTKMRSHTDLNINKYHLFVKHMRIICISEKVAFHAVLSSAINGTTPGQTIIFDQTTTNAGNAYNVTTGQFTTHVAGHYVFSVTLLIQRSTSFNKRAAFQLRQNGNIRISLYADAHQTDLDFGTASGTAVLYLNSGDIVDVTCRDGNLYIEGSLFKYSFFSGFLLGKHACVYVRNDIKILKMYVLLL